MKVSVYILSISFKGFTQVVIASLGADKWRVYGASNACTIEAVNCEAHLGQKRCGAGEASAICCEADTYGSRSRAVMVGGVHAPR